MPTEDTLSLTKTRPRHAKARVIHHVVSEWGQKFNRAYQPGARISTARKREVGQDLCDLSPSTIEKLAAFSEDVRGLLTSIFKKILIALHISSPEPVLIPEEVPQEQPASPTPAVTVSDIDAVRLVH